MSNHLVLHDHDLELHNMEGSVLAASASPARAPPKNENQSSRELPNIDSAMGSTRQGIQLHKRDRHSNDDGIPPPMPNERRLTVHEAGAPSNRTVRYALARFVHGAKNMLTSDIHVGAFYGASMFSFVANPSPNSVILLKAIQMITISAILGIGFYVRIGTSFADSRSFGTGPVLHAAYHFWMGSNAVHHGNAFHLARSRCFSGVCGMLRQ